MSKKFGCQSLLLWALPLAALYGLLGVGMAAYASHGLGFIAEGAAREAARTSLQSAVQMQLFHAPVLLALGLWGAVGQRSNWALLLAAALFALGVLLFSGLIYLRVLMGFDGLRPWVPVGGMALMAGWLALLPAAFWLRKSVSANGF